MKRYLWVSFSYLIAGLAGGIFYREFTKAYEFTGDTALGKVHVHLLLLGMVIYLLIALFSRHYDLKKETLFKVFTPIYNSGVILTVVMMIVRGVYEVTGTALSTGANSAIAGIAGLGHGLVGAGLILLILTLIKCVKKEEADKEPKQEEK